MKAKVLFVCIFTFYSLNLFAAFNSAESKQLSEINYNSERLKRDALALLAKAQQNQTSDNPDKKHLIDSLRVSWDITIEKKCALETSESYGTDAEISEVNNCLTKGYKEETEYFNNMLP
ncbi:hypothetical protein ACN5LI_000777 [Cronobacter turicensis]|jgi:uncharacterized protein with NRDE domain